MSLSAILISATVTVFAFAVGEAIAPALSRAIKDVLLFPFRVVSDTYRNRVEVLHLLKVYAIWISIPLSLYAIGSLLTWIF